MPTPCDKGPDIETLRRTQDSHGAKIDQILHIQKESNTELKTAIDGLTEIIKSDIATRKDVEQLKKDRETLFELIRKDAVAIERIEIRNAKCDGAGIFENFPKMWNWYQQEQGLRRFLPTLLAVISTGLAVYVTFSSPYKNVILPHDHDVPAAVNSRDPYSLDTYGGADESTD